MKKIFSGFLCVTTILTVAVPAFAATNAKNVNTTPLTQSKKAVAVTSAAVKYTPLNYSLTVNDNSIKLGTAKILKIGKEVMIPVEPIAKALGITVKYDSKKKSVHVSNGKMQSDLVFNVDSYCAYSVKAIGMTAPKRLGAAPATIGGTTYVPAEFFKILFTNPDSVSIKNSTINMFTSPSKASDKTKVISGMPNPLIKYNTIDEARKAVGFTFAVPSNLVDGYNMKDIIVISKDLAEIFYRKDNNEILYRTAKGNADISGDYNVYSTIKTVTVGNLKVTAKGAKVNSINLAIWSDNGISYSLSFSQGVSEEVLSNIIQGIK